MSEDGSADSRLASALARGERAELFAALVGARVFAAISATATAHHQTSSGLRADSSAQMAVLLLEVDGRRALPVFADVAALEQWRPDARPVPLSGQQACRAALDEGADALVLDPSGVAVTLVLDELHLMADGFVPVPGSTVATRVAPAELDVPGAVPDELIEALRIALAPERLRAARLLAGPAGLVLGVSPHRPLAAPALAALAHRVASRLGPALPAEGLDLAQVPSRGAGVPVLGRSRLSWSR